MSDEGKAFDDTTVPDWAADDDGSEAVVGVGDDGEQSTNIDEEETPDPTQENLPESGAESTDVEEPAEVQFDEAAEPQTETQGEQAEVDWQKRYGDLFRMRQEDGNRFRELETENRQLREEMSKVVPVLQQLARKPPSDEQLVEAGIDPDVYKTAVPIIDQQVAMRTAQIEQRMAYEAAVAEERQYAANVARNVAGFMDKRGIDRGSDLDGAVGTFLNRLAYESDQRGLDPLDLTDESMLEIALEAAQSPTFGQLLLANPDLIDDDERVGLARKQAAVLDGIQPVATTQTSQGSEPLPHVVRGRSSGNPRKGSPRDFDPLADAKALTAEEKGSIF